MNETGKIDHFPEAYRRTMGIEGRGQLSNNVFDPGGMTFSGISRVYWSNWGGWALIDAWLKQPKGTPQPPELEGLVLDFYRVNFWQRIQGDVLADIWPDLAYEVFDSSVNVDVSQAVRFLQQGYNVARGEMWSDLEDDGKLGPNTVEAIRVMLSTHPREDNQEILLNCMNGEQYIFYRNNPRRRKFRGWFRRV